MNRYCVRLIAAAVILAAMPVWAASFLVPMDRYLTRRADAIVLGTVADSRSEINHAGRYVTVTTLAIEAVVKGQGLEGEIQITEPGGIVGNIGVAVSGGATYTPGERVLVFLEKTEDGYRTWGMTLGKFSFTDDGQHLLRRGDEGVFGWNEADRSPYVERARKADRFLDFIRATSMGFEVEEDYYVEAGARSAPLHITPLNHFPAAVYTRGTDQSVVTRWKIFDMASSTTYNAAGSPAPTPAEITAAQKAMANWRNEANSNINTLYGTVTADPFDADTGPSDGKNTIVFNSTKGISGPIIGYAFWKFTVADGTNIKNGSSFGTIIEGDVSIKTGLAGGQLNTCVVHEVGHTLGLRHSDRPNTGEPFATSAVMASTIPAALDGNLQQWDREAANHVYGDGTLGPVCVAPTITTQPASRTIVSGSSTTLSVGADGTTPLSYQWYQGNSGDLSRPVGTNSASYNTGPLLTTTSFWVKVTNACTPPANSNTATVTVTPCTRPSISTEPQNATVVSGQGTTLSVIATGTTPLSYEWYRGSPGDISSGILGTESSFPTGPLSATTTFWVRVRNACGDANSAGATVTVTASCIAPTITEQPSSSTVLPGESATLTVTATGTSLIYEWYRGSTGDTSSGILGSEPTFVTGALNVTTSFWVRVRNDCGRADSNTATVTAQLPCPPPQAPQLSTQTTTPAADTAVTINWSTPEEALQFHIEIARDANFTDIAHTFRAAGSARSATFVFPEPGTYHLRLFINHRCGIREASSRLTFNVAPEPPRIAVTAKPSGMFQVTGETTTSTDNYTLTNFGGTATTIQLTQTGNFFTQDPTSFTLQPGASQIITFTATSQPEERYLGTSTPRGTGVPALLTIPVRLLVASRPPGNPEVRASTNRVDVSGAEGDVIIGSVQYTNQGDAPARGILVSDVPWLIPQTDFVDIAPGQTVTFSFRIDRALRASSRGSAIGTLSLVYLRGGSSAKLTPAGSAPPPGSKSTLVTVSDTVKPPVTTEGIPPLADDEIAFFVPGVGHLQGSVGLFVSDVSILNTGGLETLKDLRIYYVPSGSSAGSAKLASFSEVSANQSLNLADVAKSVFSSEQQLGNLQVRANKVNPLSINANIFNVSNAAGTYGTTIPIFRSDRSAAAEERLFLTGLRKDSSGYTNLFFQETAGQGASVHIDFLSAGGSVLSSRDEFVGPYSLVQIQNPLPQGAVATVVTNTSTSGAKILAHATPVDQLSGDTWSIADWARQFGYSMAEPMVIPVGGKLRGANNSDFRTDVSIMNTGAAPGSGTLRYYPTGGTPIDRELSLAPLESRILTDVVGTLFGINTTSVGYLVYTPASGTFAVSSRTYTLVAGEGSTFGTGVPTLSLASSLKPGSAPQKFAGIEDAAQSTSQAAKPGTFRTNFGIVETSGEAVNVRATMRYTAVAGSAAASGVASADFFLNPRQLLLVPSITGAIMGADRALFAELRDIQVDFEIVGGNGNVVIFTTATDNGTNDTAFRAE